MIAGSLGGAAAATAVTMIVMTPGLAHAYGPTPSSGTQPLISTTTGPTTTTTLPTSTTAPSPSNLAFTGADVTMTTAIGAAAVAGGGMVVLATKKRRRLGDRR